MLTALTLTIVLAGSSLDQVAVITAAPLRRPPATTAEPADTVRVCRWETQTGSNRRGRVCRDIPRQGVQDEQTREFMRDRQRYTPDPSG